MGFSATEIVQIVRELGSCTALNLAVLGMLIYMHRRQGKVLANISNGVNNKGQK